MSRFINIKNEKYGRLFASLIYTPRPCNCGDADKPQILTIQEHLTEITMQAERIGKNLSEHADTLERNLGGLKIE